MAVEAVIALMVDKLAELLSKDAQLLGMHGEINRIREELDKMRPFLKDADIKQKEDEAVRVWMKDIRDICFDVDDVIDILGQGQAAQDRHGFVERLKRRISDQITRYKVSKEIERIELNIKGISRSRESYGIRETSSTQRFQEVSGCSVPPEKPEIVITTVDDLLTNEERTGDIDEGRQEASSSSRNLQAHRRVSTLPGEPEEVGLQEEINTVGQQLIEEEPRPWDGTRDISEGKLEASSSTPGLKADRRFSTLPGEPEEVGLQEGINTVGQQLIEEEPGPYDGTRDISEGKLEASSSTPCLKADRQFSTLPGEPEEVGLQEEINKVSQQLIKKEPSPCDGTRDLYEGRQEENWWQLPHPPPWFFEQATKRQEEATKKEEAKRRSREAKKAEKAKRRYVEDLINSAPSLAVFSGCYAPPEKIEIVITTVNDQLTNEERTRDIDEGRQEASSSSRHLQAHRPVSTLPGEPEGESEEEEGESEEVGLQEGIDTVSEGDSVFFEEPQLVGQHREFRTVRDQLMTEEQRRRVISIFGIGGSGKTALAKKILNDVKDHFDCHALVYVSQQCQIKDILVRIIKGVAGHYIPRSIQNLDEVDLGLILRDEYLSRKRYLVVINDIWTTEAWDSLILQLPDAGNKSRVLVTTRIRDVALHADPSGHHHEMRLLNDDESWELFMKKIFPTKDPLTACPSELKEIGWKILKKCGGLPLSILVLGGLLATKEMRECAWSKVLESIPESSKKCTDILALCYCDLPPYLKPCFLYFGLFREDDEIGSREMIRLWIAESFIQQKGKNKNTMEGVAEDYLEELVSRSMIQVASERPNGSIHKCRIHDLLRELSIFVATKNNFFPVDNDNDTSSSSTRVRRLAATRSIGTLRSNIGLLGL